MATLIFNNESQKFTSLGKLVKVDFNKEEYKKNKNKNPEDYVPSPDKYEQSQDFPIGTEYTLGENFNFVRNNSQELLDDNNEKKIVKITTMNNKCYGNNLNDCMFTVETYDSSTSPIKSNKINTREIQLKDLEESKKCYKLELAQYNFDVIEKLHIILFKIVADMSNCPTDVNIDVNTDVNTGVNFIHKIELKIPAKTPDKPLALNKGEKYTISVIAGNGEKQGESLLLSIESQNDVFNKWYAHLIDDPEYKNKLTKLKITGTKVIEVFNAKYGSPYYVYGKFEKINQKEGGAPSRKSRKSRITKTKKSRKIHRKSRKSRKH
jgi:hypothetical protein